MAYLFVSVETDGVGRFDSQQLIRVALVVTDGTFQLLGLESCFVRGATKLCYNPNHYTLAQVSNGLTKKDAAKWIMSRLHMLQSVSTRVIVVAHNINYIDAQLSTLGIHLKKLLGSSQLRCTMRESVSTCCLPFDHKVCKAEKSEVQYKYPSLLELCQVLLPEERYVAADLHSAENKAWACKQCFQALEKKCVL